MLLTRVLVRLELVRFYDYQTGFHSHAQPDFSSLKTMVNTFLVTPTLLLQRRLGCPFMCNPTHP